MPKPPHSGGQTGEDPADEALDPDFKPLTAQEAQAWRHRQPAFSSWRVVWMQALTGLGFAVLLGLVSGELRLAVSSAGGVLAVVLPAGLFARALSRQMRLGQPGAALAGLMFWEGVKVALTVALLAVAPRLIANLSWFALVAGFVLTLKVYGLALLLSRRHPGSARGI
ncbi:MAG: ATP synthase subunit I [Limnohabitans sp.]